MRPLVWCGPTFQPTGYADEVRGMVLALEASGTSVCLSPPRVELPFDFRDTLDSASRKVFERCLKRSVSNGFVQVQHGTIDSFGPTHTQAAYSVGRSMFETDSLPSHWVAGANALDELWIPSEFNRKSFARAGVQTPMHVIPGGIDSTFFRPGVQPMPIVGMRGTVFLSVFEWRLRKGWDILLRAWVDAFDASSDVSLVLRTYPINRAHGERNIDVISATIDAFLQAECGGQTRADIAPIIILDSPVPARELPSLYNSAHAFVLPTRGEGWGRPFMESMACGVPVIATNWSAHREFLNEENGYLIEIDGLEPADDVEVPSYTGQRWASPSHAHLASLLRRVHRDRSEAVHVGERARQDMVNEWPWSRSAAAIKERLSAIHQLLDSQHVAPPHRVPASPRIVVQGTDSSRATGDSPLMQWLTAIDDASAECQGNTPLVSWNIDHRGLRPPSHHPLRAHWESAAAQTQDTAVFVTILDDDHASAATPPTSAAWIIDVGSTLANGVPPHLVTPLRDRADLVVVPQRAAYAHCLAIGVSDHRLIVVEPCIDTTPFQHHRAAFRTTINAATRFLLIGADRPHRDLARVVAAYDRAFTVADDVVLHMILPHRRSGDNTPATTIWQTRFVSQLVSGKRHPRLPRIVVEESSIHADEMPALYRANDVLLHAGTGAGTGRTLREAMAAGVPVVTTAISPASEILDRDCGWIVPLAHDGRVDIAALQVALRDATDIPGRMAKQTACQPRVAAWKSAQQHRHTLSDVLRRALAIEQPRAYGNHHVGDVMPFAFDQVRNTVIVAHADWHTGLPQSIVRSYATVFTANDDVTLAVCLDPAQGIGIADATAMIHEAIRLADCPEHSAPDVLVVADPLNEQVLQQLYTAATAIVAINDSRTNFHSAFAGCAIISALSPSAWKAVVVGHPADACAA